MDFPITGPPQQPQQLQTLQGLQGLQGFDQGQGLRPMDPKEEDSLLSQVTDKGLGALHYVGSSLGKAFGGRAVRGLLGGRPQELASAIPFSDTMGLTDERNEVSGQDLLKQWGVLEGDGQKGTFELRDLAGPALEIALDPGTYLTLGTGSALTEAGEVASKAGRLAPTMAGRIRAGQAGLAGLGLPFSKPSVLLGTGEAGARAADVLGYLGDKALYSAPGRVASRLFDPAVAGTAGEAAQRAAREAVPARKAAEAAAREDFTRVGNYLERNGKLGQGNELRAVLEGTLEGPAHPVVSQAADMMRDVYQRRLRAGQDLGRPVREFGDDYIDFASRQQTPLAKPTRGFEQGGKARDFPVRSANEVAREDLLRDVPGGTARLNELARDRDLANVLANGNNPLAGEEFVRRKYLGMSAADDAEKVALYRRSQGSGPALSAAERQRLDELTAGFKKAKGLTDWHRSLDPQYVEKGLDFFGNHPLTDQAIHGLNEARVNTGALAVHDMLAKAAKFGMDADSVPLTEALERAGLTYDVATGGGAQDSLRQALARNGLDLSRTTVRGQGVGLQDLHVPRSVVEDAVRYHQAFAMPDAMQPLLRAWDTATNAIKVGTTSLWPAFHTRNALTGLWQNFVIGARDPAFHATDPRSYLKPFSDAEALRTGKTLADAHTIPGLEHLSPEEATRALREELFHTGARVGVNQSQAGEAIGKGSHEAPAALAMPGSRVDPSLLDTADPRRVLPRSLGGRGTDGLDVRGVLGSNETSLAPVRYGQDLGHSIDDLNRTGAYIALRRQGYAPMQAMEKSTLAHFDYGGGTGFEREVMRRLVPFYSFSRNNVPFQLRELLAHPGGKVASAIKATDSFRDQSGFVPDYVGEGLAIPVGQEANGQQRFLTGLGLPYQDAFNFLGTGPNAIQRSGEKLLGMTNPLIKGPLEVASGKQFFSGRQLDDLYGPTGFTPLDQVLMNSPLARAYTSGRTLLDPRKDLADKALQLVGPGKIMDVDQDKARAIAARDLIEQSLKGNPAVRHFDRMYVPQDRLQELSPEELQLLRLYQTLEKQRQDQARANQQQVPK